jgi:hypothetical protein
MVENESCLDNHTTNPCTPWCLFWQIFEEAVGGVSKAHMQVIRVARMAGFFLRYRFVWEDGVREIPAKEPDLALRYLDAFSTTNDRTAT